jgi:hypothetical protein
MRRFTATCAALVTIACAVQAARAEGNIIITKEQVDTSGNFAARAKKAAVTELRSQNEQWTMYFIAWLKKAPGSQEVNLVFYDKADKSKEPTNAFPITTKESAKILVSSISFGTDQGFKAGHTYDVRVTRLVGGKEDVYARSTITLK